MPEVHRMGDLNTGGGAITEIPQSSVYVNGLLVSVNGSIGTSHLPCPVIPIHCQGNWVTNEGNSTVLAEGIPINRKGDTDTCGHPRDNGSTNVFVG